MRHNISEYWRHRRCPRPASTEQRCNLEMQLDNNRWFGCDLQFEIMKITCKRQNQEHDNGSHHDSKTGEKLKPEQVGEFCAGKRALYCRKRSFRHILESKTQMFFQKKNTVFLKHILKNATTRWCRNHSACDRNDSKNGIPSDLPSQALKLFFEKAFLEESLLFKSPGF